MKKLLTLFAFALVSFTANAQTYFYDVNGDGESNITDVSCLVNHILGLLNPGEEPQSPIGCPDDNHPHMVDLGLPSGTKWACCNVGATFPEDYGVFFAWGETEAKKSYDRSNYQYYRSKYVDIGSDIAGTQYDAARAQWGGAWQMPSSEQIKELIDNCTYTWTTMNDINGLQVTGSNGRTIFLPAAGSSSSRIHSHGDYWSSTQYTTDASAYKLSIGANRFSRDVNLRYYGHSVRPVVDVSTNIPLMLSTSTMEIPANEYNTMEITSGNGSYTVKSSNRNVATAAVNGRWVKITAIIEGTATITVTDVHSGQTADIAVTVTQELASYLTCPDDHHPHLIDLGLPSGTLWACCNVDANKPEEFGGYYAWGELEQKSVYDEVTYLYASGEDENGDGWFDDEFEYQDIGSDIAGTLYDVAHMKWGFSWVMPSIEQIEELIDNCSFSWVNKNRIYGGQFTGPNGGILYLPGTGDPGDQPSYANYGIYWSSTEAPPHSAFTFYFSSRDVKWGRINSIRCEGHPIRPVKTKKQ